MLKIACQAPNTCCQRGRGAFGVNERAEKGEPGSERAFLELGNKRLKSFR